MMAPIFPYFTSYGHICFTYREEDTLPGLENYLMATLLEMVRDVDDISFVFVHSCRFSAARLLIDDGHDETTFGKDVGYFMYVSTTGPHMGFRGVV